MSSYKFDTTRLSVFENYVANGLTGNNAARLAFSIDRTTYFRWKSSKSPLTKTDKCNVKLAFDRGRAQLNLKLVSIIGNAIKNGNARLALKFLVFVEPNAYGPNR